MFNKYIVNLSFGYSGALEITYSCTRKFGHPCAAATLLAISPDAYNLASCQLLLR